MNNQEFYEDQTTANMQSAMEAAKLAEEAARRAEELRNEQQNQGRS
ncbi:hypothetical protein TPA0910_87530 [Streptomyces hygroscopicus subsp. sporocinereus]|uniref:Uncharacterized protein n=1 Tax=Streptomyces hygroscopicus TaxID=1912 RepID=A0ABQ3UFF1_STRHY|nr:hypothetical protein [Streptomyces hygroscopicus]GHJ34320.1 hypothetical protein TPA0910_87530 [Streptomyces hygroscopicus]